MALDISADNGEVLDRLCEVYGFTQKIQLARHFNITASSLQNRYSRGAISYDFAAFCSLETGASLRWILTGKGDKFDEAPPSAECDKPIIIKRFTLSEGRLTRNGDLSIDGQLFSKSITHPQCVIADGKTYIIEMDSSLSDGSWMVDIEGAISIRDLTVLPAKRLHVAGGKVPFECGVDEIKPLGRVVGVYSEVN
ncbi:phage repressor protein CI [Dickeya dianthicola]|uniref:phage repressor protein CI n=1 Tax=Dickeya dianthicola TaxID=204039 RepID=UPI001865CE28|nr:phage repressor protein CI [Dickeya dianthicola]QOL13268.1 phage repressor protein CI [Dickeya dianthicola]